MIGLKVFGMMNSLQNIVISGAQGLLMLMGLKIFDKDDQAAKHYNKNSVLRPGHLYQKFLIPSTSGGLEHLK